MSQYVSIRYTERLAEAGIEPSVATVAGGIDNCSLKTKLVMVNHVAFGFISEWQTLLAVRNAFGKRLRPCLDDFCAVYLQTVS